MLRKNIGSVGLVLLGALVALIAMVSIPDGPTVFIKGKDSEEYYPLSSIMNSKADVLSDLGITKISPIDSSNPRSVKIESIWCEGDYTVTNEFGPFTATTTGLTEWIVYADKALKNKNSLTEAKERFTHTIDVLIQECVKDRDKNITWLEPQPINFAEDIQGRPSGESFVRLEWDSQLKNVPRAIPIRLGVDINIGEDQPAQLSAKQFSVTNIEDCPEIEVYPKRPKGEKCISILQKDGETYPVFYSDGSVDVWTVNQNPQGKYIITRPNGKTVDLGLGSD